MATLNYDELQALWIRAGGDPKKAPKMAAIAMAESGGVTTAEGQKRDIGLWQINSNVWTQWSKEQLRDPLTNAKAAVYIEKKQGYQAWSVTHGGGAAKYIKFLASPLSPLLVAKYGKDNVGNVDDYVAGKVDDVVGKVSTPISAAVDKVTNVVALLAINYVFLVGGVILVLIGAVILLRKPITTVAGVAAPAGKVAKAAKTVQAVTGK